MRADLRGVVQLAVGLLFLAAILPKLKSPQSFLDGVVQYRVPASSPIVVGRDAGHLARRDTGHIFSSHGRGVDGRRRPGDMPIMLLRSGCRN